MGRARRHEGGSSNPERGDVLRVLGVLKIATAGQIYRLECPHLSYRHTGKKPADRRSARNKAARNAARDLIREGLVIAAGSTVGRGEALFSLTSRGLEAAAAELDRPGWEMGGTASNAGHSGAPHAMSVNETVLALIRPKPDLGMLTGEPADVLAAAEAMVGSPDGIGTINSYATEVPLPLTGAWASPGRGGGGVQADIVLDAPEAGIPLLFIEVDNGHETAQKIAAKFPKYRRFIEKAVKDEGGKETGTPLWHTRWPQPAHGPYWGNRTRPSCWSPPSSGPATRPTWCARSNSSPIRTGRGSGSRRGSSVRTRGGSPSLRPPWTCCASTGPAGQVFRRFGRSHDQCLTDAVDNPRQTAVLARRRLEDEERVARANREREARRPVCADCGTAFTDAQWKATGPSSWNHDPSTRSFGPFWGVPAPSGPRPQRYDHCSRKAATEARQKAMEEDEIRRAQATAEEKRRMQEAAEAERKARRFPHPFRS